MKIPRSSKIQQANRKNRDKIDACSLSIQQYDFSLSRLGRLFSTSGGDKLVYVSKPLLLVKLCDHAIVESINWKHVVTFQK